MDAKAFFQKILPHTGIKILAVMRGREEQGPVSYITFESDNYAEEMADYIRKINNQKNRIYFAVNSFKGWYKDEKGIKHIRTKANVHSCKCFFDDFDVGKKDGYQSQSEVIEALAGFIKTVGVPKPMIVSSGVGIHVYWPLLEEITRQQWAVVAELKRKVYEYLGIKADGAVMTDSSRILRPPGTINHKNGKIVKVLMDAPAIALKDILAPLQKFAEEKGLLSPKY